MSNDSDDSDIPAEQRAASEEASENASDLDASEIDEFEGFDREMHGMLERGDLITDDDIRAEYLNWREALINEESDLEAQVRVMTESLNKVDVLRSDALNDLLDKEEPSVVSARQAYITADENLTQRQSIEMEKKRIEIEAPRIEGAQDQLSLHQKRKIASELPNSRLKKKGKVDKAVLHRQVLLDESIERTANPLKRLEQEHQNARHALKQEFWGSVAPQIDQQIPETLRGRRNFIAEERDALKATREKLATLEKLLTLSGIQFTPRLNADLPETGQFLKKSIHAILAQKIAAQFTNPTDKPFKNTPPLPRPVLPEPGEPLTDALYLGNLDPKQPQVMYWATLSTPHNNVKKIHTVPPEQQAELAGQDLKPGDVRSFNCGSRSQGHTMNNKPEGSGGTIEQVAAADSEAHASDTDEDISEADEIGSNSDEIDSDSEDFEDFEHLDPEMREMLERGEPVTDKDKLTEYQDWREALVQTQQNCEEEVEEYETLLSDPEKLKEKALNELREEAMPNVVQEHQAYEMALQDLRTTQELATLNLQASLNNTANQNRQSLTNKLQATSALPQTTKVDKPILQRQTTLKEVLKDPSRQMAQAKQQQKQERDALRKQLLEKLAPQIDPRALKMREAFDETLRDQKTLLESITEQRETLEKLLTLSNLPLPSKAAANPPSIIPSSPFVPSSTSAPSSSSASGPPKRKRDDKEDIMDLPFRPEKRIHAPSSDHSFVESLRARKESLASSTGQLKTAAPLPQNAALAAKIAAQITNQFQLQYATPLPTPATPKPGERLTDALYLGNLDPEKPEVMYWATLTHPNKKVNKIHRVPLEQQEELAGQNLIPGHVKSFSCGSRSQGRTNSL